jgi:hypothetical protein
MCSRIWIRPTPPDGVPEMTEDRSSRKFICRLGRRNLLGAMATGLIARNAHAQPTPDLDDDLRNLRLLDIREGGRRATVVTPKYINPGVKLPVCAFLHGLGETGEERAGAYAFIERYGLGAAWQRLKRAPIERTSKRGEWTDARLNEVNDDLAKNPFKGMVLVCPYMPMPNGTGDHDAYAKWLTDALLPRVRKETPASDEPAKTLLCGVSLGGYCSLEVMVRTAESFGAWAGVQTAVGDHMAPGYAEKISQRWEAAGKRGRPMLLLSSTLDHWKHSSEALAAAFKAKNMNATFRVTPGPHDQPWLKESGMIEALLWLDRAARA